MTPYLTVRNLITPYFVMSKYHNPPEYLGPPDEENDSPLILGMTNLPLSYSSKPFPSTRVLITNMISWTH